MNEVIEIEDAETVTEEQMIFALKYGPLNISEMAMRMKKDMTSVGRMLFSMMSQGKIHRTKQREEILYVLDPSLSEEKQRA